MPNRILREGILTSERIQRLNWAEEVFYRRLMSVVDDFGRYYANPMLLRAACYPLALDKVSDSDVGKWLLATEKAGLVRVYPASDGKRYIQMLDFRQQVRAHVSKFPQPCADESQMNSGCVADAKQTIANEHLDVDVDVDDIASRDSPASQDVAFELPLIDGTEHPFMSSDVSEWKSAYPAVDVEQQLRSMRAWLLANPVNRKTPKGIRRFANAWLQKAQDKAPRTNQATKTEMPEWMKNAI
jgi:hypothetical protein